MSNRGTIVSVLEDHNACNDALRWVEQQEPDVTPEDLWARCQRPDWMAWVMENAGDMSPTEDTFYRLCVLALARIYMRDGSPDSKEWKVAHERITSGASIGDGEAAEWPAPMRYLILKDELDRAEQSWRLREALYRAAYRGLYGAKDLDEICNTIRLYFPHPPELP